MGALSLAEPDPSTAARPLHIVSAGASEAFLSSLDSAAAAYARAVGFDAARGRLLLLPGADGIAAAVVGLGGPARSGEDEDGATIGAVDPWLYGDLPRTLPEGTTWALAGEGHGDGAAAALGWGLGAYRYEAYRLAKRKAARLVRPEGAAAARAADLAAVTGFVRDLVNAPAADLGPAELAAAMSDLAAEHGAAFEEVAGVALDAGFPAVAAVGRGADHPARAPRVGVLRWAGAAGPDAPLIALCGKGVCFDTGGLDLKPAGAMLRMKKDMAGAAVVLGLAAAVMRARVPVRLLVLVGAVENAVSARAFRPLDVLRTRKGLTVELGNTDAEGRLVLADLLAYACEHDPALLLDCATLTGAARVALGPDLPALFTRHDDLAATLLAAGTAGHDPVWRLPLHPGYDSWLDSATADMNNVTTKPMAGAVVAALFLARFVPARTRWAHLDLYGWNDAARPGQPEGGEAQGLRALLGGVEAIFSGPRANGAATTA